MSTKVTIKASGYGPSGGYHLYDEIFEPDNVYLELTGVEFMASVGPGQERRVVVQIPIEWAKRLGLIPADREAQGAFGAHVPDHPDDDPAA